MDSDITTNQPGSGGYKGKLLKILIFDGNSETPAVCIALPLNLAKLAGRLLPSLAKLIPFALDLGMTQNKQFGGAAHLIRENYADLDEALATICQVIEEGIDELEDLGAFDFVSLGDEDSGVKIRIE